MPEGQHREINDLFKIKRSAPGHDQESIKKKKKPKNPSDSSIFRLIKMGELHISEENLGYCSNDKDLKQTGLPAQNSRHMCSQNGGHLSTACVLTHATLAQSKWNP